MPGVVSEPDPSEGEFTAMEFLRCELDGMRRR